MTTLRELVKEAVEFWPILDHGSPNAAVQTGIVEWFEGWRRRAKLELERSAPKYQKTWCSQCGLELGPGDHGVSHCQDHA
jgi:hypothetical protein